MTIKHEIRTEVIRMAEAGKSQNEIAKILHISKGSTNSIISDWKKKQRIASKSNRSYSLIDD
ncbi:MAG TPA: helix-turn-helix domain-containing protein [Candidatus Bathyarchaeia archaeon]|nr:helix-turn-helix domain-containing protein [Candidatus Bathyarchaeia archaeon]